MKYRPSYIPLNGDEFFRHVEGHSPAVLAALIRLAWHYWSITECSGLKDDSEWLRRIARLSETEWDEALPVFSNVFEQDKSGKWQHLKLKRDWHDSVERIRVASEKGRTAANAMWAKKRQT